MYIELIVWLMAGIGTYIFLVWFITYLKGSRSFKKIVIPKKFPTVSIAIPAYNEEENIGNAIVSLLNSDYPKNKLEIIVINDGSTDNTKKIAEKYTKNRSIKLINQQNMGKGIALNNSLKVANGELFGVVDADTTVERDTLTKLICFFDSKKVGAVISGIKPFKAKNLLEKFQRVEYFLSILVRKLMDKLETNYVTPGALSLYRKDVITKLGGFAERNITEDLEMGLRLRSNGYVIKASIDAFTFTIIPNTLHGLFKQRMRWNRGFLINIRKYKHLIFNSRYGYLSTYQIPTALVAALLLGPIGFGIAGYIIYNFVYDYYLYFSSVGLSIPQLFHFPTSANAFLLGFNVKVYYPLIVTVLLTTTLIILAQRLVKENYKNPLFIFLTIMIYYPLLGIFWLLALFAEILQIGRAKW